MDASHFNISYLVSLTHVHIILCIAILILLLKHVAEKCRRDSRFVKFAETLPGPYALPVLGNSLNFLFPGKEGPNVQQMKYSKRYGSMYRMWIGNQLVVSLSDPEDLKVVFQSPKMLGKSKSLNEPFRALFDDGLFTIESVQQWKTERKILDQFFTKNKLNYSTPVINDILQKSIESLQKRVNGPEFDIEDFCYSISFDVNTRIIFNYQTIPKEKSALNLITSLQGLVVSNSLQMFLPILKTRFINYIIYKTVVWPQKNKFYKFIKKAIAKDLDQIKKKIENGDDDLEFYKSSLLAALYKMERETGCEDKMIQQLLLFLMAGIETTSNTISFNLLMIAMHPEVQEKLYNEIYDVFGQDDRQADCYDIERLTYLDQVIKETSRRFTPVPLIFREVEEDAKIGSRVFPAGTALMINISNVHLNEEYYPQPYEFNPDNFSTQAVKNRPKYTWIPFSAGSRICIGKHLAEIEIKMAIVELLRNFTVHTSKTMEDIKLSFGFATRNANGYHVSLKRRHPKKKRSM